MVFAEIVIVSHLGLTKLSYEDFTPIARLNFDSAAITDRGDTRREMLEDSLAASCAKPGDVKMGNSGPGSTWQLAHAALEGNVSVKFNAIPSAALALLGGRVDAVAGVQAVGREVGTEGASAEAVRSTG